MVQNFWKDKVGRYEIRPTTIETVDQSLVDYFDKKLALKVTTVDDKREKVPVVFATGERWKLIRDGKGLRDENGTLILPVIAVRRTEFERTPGFGGLMQEVPSIVISKQVHEKTALVRTLVDQRRRNGFFEQKKRPPVIETLSLPFPDFANVFYEIIIWTQFQTQMNEILEKIFYNYDHMDSFVLPVEYDGKEPKGNSYYFVGFREGTISSQSNTEEFTDQERIIKYQYNVKIPAYFMLDPKTEPLAYGKLGGTPEEGGGKIFVFKDQNVIDIKLTETILTAEEFEEMFG